MPGLVCVTLAVGEIEHTWGIEDVFLSLPIDEDGAYLLDRASEQWRETNPHREVAFLTLYSWEYVGEGDDEDDATE